MNSRGFTLVELLIVVAIMGILGMVAMPASGEGYDQRLDLVDVQLQDAFGRAAALARSTRQPHGVVFDLASDRFAVVDSSGTAVIDPLTRRDYLVDFDRPDQPEGIDFSAASFGSTGASVIFDSQGLPIEAGSLTVRCHRSVRTYTLDKATGKLSTS